MWHDLVQEQCGVFFRPLYWIPGGLKIDRDAVTGHRGEVLADVIHRLLGGQHAKVVHRVVKFL